MDSPHVGAPNHVRLSGVGYSDLGGLWPDFGFSDAWQLVINTGATIVTFLMVFARINGYRCARASQAAILGKQQVPE